MYTVRRLSNLAGVTVRTLHHYDEIGLLKPASVGSNGYRYCGQESLYRLQQILFYRELDVPLEDIKRIVDGPDFDRLSALKSHRAALQAEIARIKRLIQTIDRTTSHLKGITPMEHNQLFRGFTEAEQEKTAEEAAQRWDAETVRASNAPWNLYPPERKQRIMDEGNAVYTDLIAAIPDGTSSPKVQAIIQRWRNHLQHFWSPDDDQLLGLADLYNDDPRFHANFQAMHHGLAAFMREAVKVYVNDRKQRTSEAD